MPASDDEMARFGRIHPAYLARRSAVIDGAKTDGAASRSLASKDAATMFLSLIQGLGFQFAIAQLPLKLVAKPERTLAIYLQAITASADAVERARRTVTIAKSSPAQRGRLTDFPTSDPSGRPAKLDKLDR
jgi:hypothetical protein